MLPAPDLMRAHARSESYHLTPAVCFYLFSLFDSVWSQSEVVCSFDSVGSLSEVSRSASLVTSSAPLGAVDHGLDAPGSDGDSAETSSGEDRSLEELLASLAQSHHGTGPQVLPRR